MSSLSQKEVRAHWEREAARHGAGLRATTKTSTAKRLEVDALARALRRHGLGARAELSLLEVGCGNGHNLRALAEMFPNARLDGVDYVPGMIAAAEEWRAASPHAGRIALHVGDVLALEQLPALAPHYDAVLTDRCLINLGSTERQRQALLALAERIEPGGWLFAIENSRRSFELQNDCRERVGLARRTPAGFNHFIEEEQLFPAVAHALELVDAEDFISLHDLALYVLGPAASGGTIDYDGPLVEAATQLLLSLPDAQRRGFGEYGQNRLYALRRRGAAA
jgi:SAM-dependent methyltransferase